SFRPGGVVGGGGGGARGRAGGTLGPPLGQELQGTLERQRLHRVRSADAGIRLAVRDVGPETAFLDHDRAFVGGILAELPERGPGLPPAPSGAGLSENRARLVERHGEQLL